MSDTGLPRLFPTVVHMLAAAVAERPDAPALEQDGQGLSYADYGAAVAGLASELEPYDVRGRVVVVHMTSSISAVLAMMAVLAAGAQLCPTNPAYTERELGEILSDAAPVLVLTEPALLDAVRACAAPGLPAIDAVALERALPASGAPGLSLRLGAVDPDGLAILQYTGGTSGRSKGVNLRHRAIATNVSQREAVLPLRLGAERILCVMPLFHSFATAMGLFAALHSQSLLIIQPRYRPEWVVAALRDGAVSVFPAGPTVFISLLGFAPFRSAPYPALRYCFSGSAALPEATLHEWAEVTGCIIYEGYGQTEAGPILTYNGPNVGARPGTVGPPLPGTEIGIVDVVSGAPLTDPDAAGEIRARGPQLMDGYRNRPDETAEALRDGWLYTGDIGRFDADGFLSIEDRKKDLVIVSGYNVYPREIDEVLMAAHGVLEAAAVGLPDSYRGEVIHALVVARPDHRLDASSLAAHCAANLAPYKRPAAFHLVEALPRTTVGKVDRKAIRARLQHQRDEFAA